MIELTWGQLRNPEFGAAVRRLMREPMELKSTIKIATIYKRLEKEEQVALTVADSVKENIKNKSQSEQDKASDEFEKTKFQFDLPKVSLAELEKIKISASELLWLEPFIKDPVVLPEPSKTKASS